MGQGTQPGGWEQHLRAKWVGGQGGRATGAGSTGRGMQEVDHGSAPLLSQP